MYQRVGNGLNTYIWLDNWIPTPVTHHIQSTPKLLPLNAKVQELIHPNTFILKYKSNISRVLTPRKPIPAASPLALLELLIRGVGGLQRMEVLPLNQPTIWKWIEIAKRKGINHLRQQVVASGSPFGG